MKTRRTTKSLPERVKVAKEYREEVNKKMQGLGLTFLNELSGQSSHYDDMKRKHLFLCYLMYEADLPSVQIEADLGMKEDRIKKSKAKALSIILAQ